MTSKQLALGAARIAAVVFALSALGYLVVREQRRADAEGARTAAPVAGAAAVGDPAVTNAAPDVAFDTELDTVPDPAAQAAPVFLPTSKSATIDARLLQPATPAAPAGDPVFLMGSKSGVVTTVEGGAAGEPVFLPSSKVLAIDSTDLLLPQRGQPAPQEKQQAPPGAPPQRP